MKQLKNRKLHFTLLGCLGGFAVLASSAHLAFSARFANQFVEFELPAQWQCNLEGAEWVCQSLDQNKKKEAMIVLAAKLKGDQDSLDQYLSYLKGAKSFTSVQGRPIKSEPKTATIVTINGQNWVDALHLESEIPGFYTRYLATVIKDIGVLVTYSINKDRWQNYLGDFENMVSTIRVFRKEGLGLNAHPQGGSLFDQSKIPQAISESTVFNNQAISGSDGSSEEKPKSKQDDDFMFYLIIGAGALGFILLKKKKK